MLIDLYNVVIMGANCGKYRISDENIVGFIGLNLCDKCRQSFLPPFRNISSPPQIVSLMRMNLLLSKKKISRISSYILIVNI